MLAKEPKQRIVRVALAQSRLGFWVLMAIAAFLFLLRVDMPITDGDTAFYAKIALNILETGDWQTLRFKNWEIIDKPPLTIWPIAVTVWLFGNHEWAVRLWHSLLALGTAAVTYVIAAFCFSRRIAFWSTLILLSTLLFFYMAQVPQQDIPALFFFALTFYGALRLLYEGRPVFSYLAWASVGLAVLTRALHGIVFPAGVVAIFVLLHARFLGPFPALAGGDVRSNDPRRSDTPSSDARKSGARKSDTSRSARRSDVLRNDGLRNDVPRNDAPESEGRLSWTAFWTHQALGALLCFLIAAPWYILEYQVHGWPLIDLFFGPGNSRFMETDEGLSAARFLSIFPLALLALLPWTGFLWWSLRDGVNRVRKGRSQTERLPAAGDLLALIWLALAFLLPMMISWRIIRYLIPMAPAAAILTARYLDPVLEGAFGEGDASRSHGRGALRRVTLGIRGAGIVSLIFIVPLFLATAFVYLGNVPAEQELFIPLLGPFLGVLTLAALAFSVLAIRRRGREAVTVLAGGSLVSYALLLVLLGAHVDTLVPWHVTAQVVNETRTPNQRVVYLDPSDNWFLDYYVEAYVYPVDEAELAAMGRSGESAVGVANYKRDLERLLQKHPDLAIEVLHETAFGPVVFRLAADQDASEGDRAGEKDL